MDERRAIRDSEGIQVGDQDEVEVRAKDILTRLGNGHTAPLKDTSAWLSLGLVAGRGEAYQFSS